jgi:crossover junction endodeoxyribonuclease RusA
MTGRSWRIDLPLTAPLSLNAREHHMVKARRVAQVRAVAKVLTRAAHVPPLERVAIELHYVPRDSRRRDRLNLVATLKPVEDGIVDAGVIPDDTDQWSEPTMPIIDPPVSVLPRNATGRLYVVIHELEARP